MQPLISGMMEAASKSDDGSGMGGDRATYEVGLDSRAASFE